MQSKYYIFLAIFRKWNPAFLCVEKNPDINGFRKNLFLSRWYKSSMKLEKDMILYWRNSFNLCYLKKSNFFSCRFKDSCFYFCHSVQKLFEASKICLNLICSLTCSKKLLDTLTNSCMWIITVFAFSDLC